MADILRSLGVRFEHQAIVYRTGSFICCDFLVRDRGIAFELDGQSHMMQHGYDIGRDRWLEQAHNIRTVRIANRKVFYEREYVERLVKRALGIT